MLFRTRDLLVHRWIQTISALRVHLAEFSIAAPPARFVSRARHRRLKILGLPAQAASAGPDMAPRISKAPWTILSVVGSVSSRDMPDLPLDFGRTAEPPQILPGMFQLHSQAPGFTTATC